MDEAVDGSLPDAKFRSLAEATGDLFYVLRIEPDLAFEFLSGTAESLVGYSARQHYEDPDLIRRMIDPRDAQVLADALAVEVGGEMAVELRWIHRDGSIVWTQHRGRKVQRADGTVVIEGSGRNITSLRRAQHALVESEREFRALAENITDVIVRTGLDFSIQYASPSITTVLGWRPEEVLGRHSFDSWHPDDVEDVARARVRMEGGETVRFRARALRKDGAYTWIEAAGRMVVDDEGRPQHGLTVARDISEQVRAEDALSESEERFRLAMAEAPQGMAIVGMDGTFVEINPALCSMLGRDAAWMLGHGIDDVLYSEDVAAAQTARDVLLAGADRYVVGEHRFVRSDGTIVWVDHSIGLVRSSGAAPVTFVSQMRDVTEDRAAVQSLSFRAAHDVLTGLMNRGELVDRLAQALDRDQRTGRGVAVLFCDVDNLKAVNDSRGHAAGDALIAAVAQRVRECIRTSDLVARIGGDEFVVVLDGVRGVADAERIAATVLDRVSAPIDLDDGPIRTSVSVGVTLADPGKGIDALLRDADTALYVAKRAGGNRVAVFNPDAALQG